MLSIIVAVAENNAIGQKGDLLCHLPADLKHFKEVTSGHTVIMGKRTFFSLPISKKTGTHALPNRRHIVITDIAGETFEGAESAYSIDDAIRLATETAPAPETSKPSQTSQTSQTAPAPETTSASADAFVIGGGMIYKQFMPLADRLYITHMHQSFPDADTFFPAIEPTVWKPVSTERHEADENNPLAYTFVTYDRI